jgi:WD40 repeat protein
MVGPYEIIRPLGKGGMGHVLLSRDTRLGRLAALKFPITAPNPARAARFLAEARATARLSHENVVVIYEVGEHQQRPFMALEYLTGHTLEHWVKERKARRGDTPGLLTSPRRAVEVMLPVVRALEHFHARGIVHRDLKPSNVMLTDAGTIKVLDFGIAKAEAEADDAAVADVASDRLTEATSLTRVGATIGTARYMAPEQWGVDTVDHRADLWAVGLMLYHLLFGESLLASVVRGEHLASLLDLDTPLRDVHADHPELGKLGAIIDRCLVKRKTDRISSAAELLGALLGVVPAHAGAALRDEDHNPFAGLAAFQETDAERFFGRERTAHQAVLRMAEQPLLAVVGPSGAGKSSFVRAGLIPALKHSDDAWEAFVLRPGPHPLVALAGLLEKQLSSSSSHERPAGGMPEGGDGAVVERTTLVERLGAEPGYLGMQLRARARRRRERMLLFIDQFEELYTLAPMAERRAFFACLAGAADDAGSPLRVVIALRADFLDQIADAYAALPELGRAFLPLPPLDRAELALALTRPLRALDHSFEPALVEQMLDELAQTRGALPLLQFTAARLWELRDRARRALTADSYRELGGVAGTLARHADTVLGAMAPADKLVARALFLRLITPERTRGLVGLGELYETDHGRTDLRRVLDRLLDARLLTLEGSGEDDGTVEIVHESLVANWPTLTRWLDEDAEDAAFLGRLRSAAREWRSGGEREGLLWTGEPAVEAQRFTLRHRGELAASEQRFLEAVIALAQRARSRRRQITIALIAGLGVIALGVSYLALRANQEAARAAQQATRADQEATQVRLQEAEVERGAARARNAIRIAAAREREDDPTTVLALVREIEPGPTPRGWSALARWALDAGVARVVLPHDLVANAAAWSPDGRRIVSASADTMVRVWSADGAGPPLVLRGHEAAVHAVAFSPDGRRIVSGSADKTLRVWNADGSGQPLILRGHDARVTSAVYSPDGQRIVSASFDKTLRVWNADGSGQPLVLRGHDDTVASAAFSHDGRRIVSASWDKTVRVWNSDGSGVPVILRGHEARVTSAELSDDGRIVSASNDKTIRVWGPDGSAPRVVLRGHTAEVSGASFSPDGRRIVSVSPDMTVRVWNADGSGQALVLRGHEGYVTSVAFSPEGERIVSASTDKTVRVWSTSGKRLPLMLRGHDAEAVWAEFSRDGRRIVSASWDKTVRVWSADGSGQPLVLRGHSDKLTSAAFSPDGQRIVSASTDKTVRVWRSDGSEPPLVLRGHGGMVFSAAFGPDGRRIVSASADKTVRVWNSDGSGQPLVLRGHDEAVTSAAFSPDGQHIVSTSADRTVRVWRSDGSGPPLVLRGHDSWVMSAVFSHDGRRIASASADKTVRVWNADGTGEPVVLRGHESVVAMQGGNPWSPDDRQIVTHSADKTVRVWNADGTGEPLVLRGSNVAFSSAAFSPDGARIVAGSDDKTIWVWSDLVPVRDPADPRLWTATAYCMPMETRRRLLDMPDELARADLERCERRVREARD